MMFPRQSVFGELKTMSCVTYPSPVVIRNVMPFSGVISRRVV
jgi:hypothetical protein